MACAHEHVNIKTAAIVDSDAGRRLRARCPVCHQFVETKPRINKKTGEVSSTGWITSDYVIREPDFDFKLP